MNPLTIKKIDGESEEETALTASLAWKIWTRHYTPLIGEEQVRYMLDKFQSAQSIRQQIRREGYVYYLAFWAGTPAGYCGIQPGSTARSVLVSKLYVDADYRKKGLAAAFVRVIVSEFDAEAIWLTVNKNNCGSIAAYRKLGFEITDSLVTDIGGGFVMDDYKMTWRKPI